MLGCEDRYCGGGCDMDTAVEAMLICCKMRDMSYTVAGGLMLSAVTQEILVLCCRSTAR